jgi:hypothetical protein
MLRHRVIIEYVIAENYVRDVPSLAYDDVMDIMQLHEDDGESCTVTLVELCMWPGWNRYCADHAVGGG